MSELEALFGGRPFDVSKCPRMTVWFSCGAASAVAGYLAIKNAPEGMEIEVVYCDTGSEHPDNVRFMRDIENWYGRKVLILKNSKYSSSWDVFEKRRYLSGVEGAPCTQLLKKAVRQKYEKPFDLQVFGFDMNESARASRFMKENPEVVLASPLIQYSVSKKECFDILHRAGIAIPAMYRLGYKNNNCIGCVKGQAGYWNKIRVDFPEVFGRMAKLERKIGAAICKKEGRLPNGKRWRKPVYLDELPPNAGRYQAEPSLSCGVLCNPESES